MMHGWLVSARRRIEIYRLGRCFDFLHRRHRNFLFDHFYFERLLDVAHLATFRTCAERRGDAFGTGAASTADAVDEIFGDLRQVKVHDMGDAIHVNAAGGYVGSDEHPVRAVFEAGQRLVTLRLGTVAVDARGAHATVG